jgi:hypothetical protein
VGPYDLGAAVPAADLALLVTNDAGNPVSTASTPRLTLTLPDQTTATPAVTQASTGTYQPAADYVPAQYGHFIWAWSFTDAGAYIPASPMTDSFEVRQSPDPTIISLPEAREILKRPAGDTSQDSIIRGYSQAISEWVEYVAGIVVTRQVTDVIRAQGQVLILPKVPVRTDLGTALSTVNRRDGSTTNGLVSITPLLTYGFMYDISDLLVDGPSGIVRHVAGLPFFYSGDPYSQYKATWWAGRKVVGWGIYEAAKIALKHLYAVERGGLGMSAAFGEEEVTDTGFGFAVPNRAVELLMAHGGRASRAVIA